MTVAAPPVGVGLLSYGPEADPPVTLGIVSFPACDVFVGLQIAETPLTAANAFTSSFMIPNDPILLGATLVGQALMVQVALPTLLPSDAVRMTFGRK